jgi:hypothetical protein
MVRPRQKITKQRVTLTISPDLLTAAKSYAYESGDSLSGLIEKLLADTIKSAGKPVSGNK